MSRYDEATVLALGDKGRLGGARFTLVGRTILRATSGGIWNEWVMRFDDGDVRTLAEARGSFTVFEEGTPAVPWTALDAGAPFDTGFVVAERGEAERLARTGETDDLPAKYKYADLSGRDGRVATIDYGTTPPRAYLGTRVTLGDLGLSPRAERPTFIPVKAAPKPKSLELWLAVGDEGMLGHVRWRVIGIVHRSVRSGGERFTWEEYVLFEPAHGFRWLVVSDGHWSLVESIEPGLVTETARGAKLGDDEFKPLGSGKARVEWATGELPWELGDKDVVDVRDYVHVPYMLSMERSRDEVVWSRGEYVEAAAVARAFGKRVLPPQDGRAPHQPKKRPTPRR